MLSVNITIGHEELRLLQQQHYSLCFAQPVEVDGVEHPGNVVLYSIGASHLSTSFTFSWDESFMVFGQQDNTYDAPISCDTIPTSVSGGQLLTLTPTGESSVKGQPSPRNPFFVVNDWQDLARAGIHVRCAVTSARGSMKEMFMPSFISRAIPRHTIVKLKPCRKISMFVDVSRRLGPGFSFNPFATKTCTIDLTGRQVAHVAFRN